jgi:hypothetical protein
VIGSIPQLASSASTASISQPNSSYPQHLQNIGDPLPKHRIIIVLPHCWFWNHKQINIYHKHYLNNISQTLSDFAIPSS